MMGQSGSGGIYFVVKTRTRSHAQLYLKCEPWLSMLLLNHKLWQPLNLPEYGSIRGLILLVVFSK